MNISGRKKRSGGLISGQLDNYASKAVEQGDSNHIIIALIRSSENTKDVDYVCGYGRDEKNHPILCVLGERRMPRIELPMTFFPTAPTTDTQGVGQWVQSLTINLYQWHQQMQPSVNDCGLRFDVKIYKAGGRKRLLHFSHLLVELENGAKP